MGGEGAADIIRRFPKWENLTLHLYREEETMRSELDAVARHIAEFQELPTRTTSVGRFYLGFRIQCALDSLGIFHPPDKASPVNDLPNDWSEQKAIEWLLIDLWARRGDHWLKLCAIGLVGPFPFYGVQRSEEGA